MFFREGVVSIKFKLYLNALIVIVCMICVGASGYFFVSRVANVSELLFEKQALPVIKINEIEKVCQTIFAKIILHSSSSDFDRFSVIEADIEEFSKELVVKVGEYKKSVGTQNAPAVLLINSFDQKWNEFLSIKDDIILSSKSFAKEDALSKIDNEGKIAHGEATKILRDILNNYQKDMIESHHDVIATRTNSAIFIVLLVVVVVFVSGTFALLIVRSILKPLNVTTEMLKDISEGEGDLGNRLQIFDQYEMGRVGKHFNNFVSKIEDIIIEVKKSATQLGSASEEISSSTQKISDGSQQQAASFEELSSSIQSNTLKATEANTLSQESVQKAKLAGKSMENTVSAISQIEKRSAQISEITNVIVEIADQTNLLALNATIEAARAGEQGRGFSVVADEVRKLAEKSTLSADEIKGLIKDSLSEVKGVVDVSKEASQQLSEIIANINSIASELQLISQTMQEQAVSMEENSAITQSTASGSEELSATAEELSCHAEVLQKLVGKFKVKS